MKANFILLLQLCLLFLASCTKLDKDLAPPAQPGVLTLRMAGLDNNSSAAVEPGQIKDLNVFLFEDGTLTEVFSNLSVAEGGMVKGMLLPYKPEANFYLLANVSGLSNDDKLRPGAKEDEFKKLIFTHDESAEQSFQRIATGHRNIGELWESGKAELFLTRAFARLDIVPEGDIKILNVTINSVAQSVYLFAQEPVQSPEGAKYISLKKEFDTPLTENLEGLFYLYEQTGKTIKVGITAEIGGIKNQLTATLPDVVKRNHIYTLKVTTVGVKVELTVQEEPWEEGEIIESTPDLEKKVLVDVENSTLPTTVKVSESKDTVFIPHYGESFKLALLADTELEVKLKGIEESDPEVTVTPTGAVTRANRETGSVVVIANEFNVTTRLTSPGSKERYVYLEVRNKNLTEYYGDRIVLVLKKNPTVFSGRIYDFFAGKTVCEMEEYADGELGFVEVDEGSTLTCDAEWIRLVQIEPSDAEQPADPGTREANTPKLRYKIEAGYRPNDPEADGRIQRGTLTVTHENGKTEAYPVSRPNNGLPVVLLDGKYWCKFNLQGNARSFEDQIKMDDAAALATDLYEYLKTCDAAEYMRLMGDAYKGTNPTGLKLKYLGEDDNKAYSYENYASTAAGAVINSSDPTKHCPPGYQLPDYTNDILPIFANRNTTFTGAGDELRTTFSHLGISRTAFRYIRRDIPHDGGTIPQLYLNKIEFTKNGARNSYALFGSGWQENNTTIDFRYTLFANKAASNANLVFGEFFSITYRNANFTRAIRCIKTPVDFIY